MEFCKDCVFTSLNADELREGDKVIVDNTMANLREDVQKGINIDVLKEVHGEDCLSRFIVKEGWYPLAYLVERAENCTNCGSHEVCGFVQNQSRFANLNRCENYKPKTELKPCPFCGGDAELSHKRNLNTWIVECSNQDCPASYMIGADFETEAEAIEAWNRRAE